MIFDFNVHNEQSFQFTNNQTYHSMKYKNSFDSDIEIRYFMTKNIFNGRTGNTAWSFHCNRIYRINRTLQEFCPLNLC